MNNHVLFDLRVLLTLLCFLAGCRTPATPPDPRVTQISPTLASQGISVQTSIQVAFDHPVTATSFTAAAARIWGPTGPIAGRWRLARGGRIAHFTPASSLPASTTIRIQLTRAIRGAAGGALAEPFSSVFR
ncbi:MAG: Ig-like domain-containing protein, partial [Planctomycetota bacterium]|nr:Ig-like domain-containing protein [Planctomycetota bacterium]